MISTLCFTPLAMTEGVILTKAASSSVILRRRMLTLRCTPLSMTNSQRSDSRAPLRYARNDIFSFVILRRKPRRDSDVRIDRVVSANRRPARSHGEKTCFYHFLLPSVGAASNESLANSFASRQRKRNLKGGACGALRATMIISSVGCSRFVAFRSA